MDLFDFAKTQQNNNEIIKIDKEAILKKAEEFYDKFGKDLYKIPKEEYMKQIQDQIAQAEAMPEDERKMFLSSSQLRSIQTLRKLEKAIEIKLGEIKKPQKPNDDLDSECS